MAPFNNPLIRFISEPRYRWLRHVLFIAGGMVLAFKGDIGVPNDPRSPELLRAIIIGDAVTFLFIMGIIYFMILYLVPRLLFRSKVFLFSIFFFVQLVLIFLLVWFIDHNYIGPLDHTPSTQHLELSLIHFVQVGAVAAVLLGSVVGLVVFKKWIHDIRRMNALQQVNLETELQQLKSQVNPHFLFNTLNNLYVLMRTDTARASEVLLRLSDLLRYQLYDSARDRILLTKDIAFMHDLLALEKIRKSDFDYEIETTGEVGQISVPPFLFIPFVENAIKHGASTIGPSYLRLHFSATENQLHFTSENSRPAIKTNQPGGLGLKNIRRRLELLYPSNHQLEIREEKSVYVVNLFLPI